jgi:hypothetical protein
MKALLQWLILSACVLALYIRAYGRHAGLRTGFFFILCIGVFVWALNRGGSSDHN